MAATLGSVIFGRQTELTVGRKAELGSSEGGGGTEAQSPLFPGEIFDLTDEKLEKFKRGWTLKTGELTAAGWKFGARIDFEVGTTNADDVDEAKIDVWNLSPLSRAIVGKGSPMVLRSGYVSMFEPIFTGTVVMIEDEFQGADIITHLTCETEAEKFLGKGFGGSFLAGTLVTEIAKEVIAASGVAVGLIADSPITLKVPLNLDPNDTMRNHLQRLAELVDFKVSFQHGRVYFVPQNFSISPIPGQGGLPGFILTPISGLISAEKVESSETQDFDLKLITFLIPMMRTDMLVFVRTKRIDAVFKIQRIVYSSNESQHRTESECTEVKAEVQL